MSPEILTSPTAKNDSKEIILCEALERCYRCFAGEGKSEDKKPKETKAQEKQNMNYFESKKIL